jgi:hypothetical protein
MRSSESTTADEVSESIDAPTLPHFANANEEEEESLDDVAIDIDQSSDPRTADVVIDNGYLPEPSTDSPIDTSRTASISWIAGQLVELRVLSRSLYLSPGRLMS